MIVRERSAQWPDLRGAGLVILIAIILPAMSYEIFARMQSGSQVVKLMIVLAGIALCIWSIGQPVLAMYATLTAAVFEKQITVLGVQTGTVELALIVFAPALFSLARRNKPLPEPFLIMFALIAGGGLVASVNAMSPGIAVWGAVRWILVLNLSAAMVCTLRTGGVPAQRRLALWFANLGTIVGLFAAAQSAGVYVIVGPRYQAVHPDSTFGYYTVYADFMALTALVATGLFLSSLKRRDIPVMVMSAVSVVVGGTSVALALSRGALLALAVGILFIMVVRITRPGTFLIGAALIATAGGVAYAFLPAATIQKFSLRLADTGITDNDAIRGSLHSAGWYLFDHHPLGIGYLNFSDQIASGAATAEQVLAHSHNLYSQMGLDVGWLGFIGFLALAGTAVWKALRSGLTSGGRAYQAIFGAGLVGYLAQGPNHYLMYETGSLIAFMVVLVGAISDPVSGLAAAEPGSGRTPVEHHHLSQSPSGRRDSEASSCFDNPTGSSRGWASASRDVTMENWLRRPKPASRTSAPTRFSQ